MKIAMLMATRGRPQQATAIVEMAHMLESGKHQVSYHIAYDYDDDHIADFNTGATLHPGPRPVSPAECWNRLAREVEADAYLINADDHVIATDCWDQKVEDYLDTFTPKAAGLFCLNDTANPGCATLFVLSNGWLDAMDREVFSEHYPFWFADLGLSEVWHYVAGSPTRLANDILAVGKAGQYNPRIRDLEFWWDFHMRTRPERLAKAACVRSKLGLPEPTNLAQMVEHFEYNDTESKKLQPRIMARVPPREPDERYLEAYRRAQDHIVK
jgi:hypothetical protein